MSSSKSKVVFDVAAAQEVIALIEDKPGDANESVLDEALDEITAGGRRVPPEDQERIAAGEAVAIELRQEAADAVQELIESDRVTRPKLLRRVGERLRGKLKRAERKARR